uniref:Uncharacterized protein n=1 Tax=Polytomella parva TaxID=51329 RepID=A0A7S0YGV5_9CHLO|mmetsp:Transcript_18677/g.33904  ORF Transcript_18677/g.33904 Transcript_18677/m.33904 type:complete len:318 (+) Transcript_18677:43-996(+)
MWKYLFYFLFFPCFFLYFAQHLLCAFFFKTQNLKKRYNASWALVTGASSGIGKSIAIKLAKQKLNVVLVALGDAVFDKTFEELKSQFPDVQFRKVIADLGKEHTVYMPAVIEATKDINVQIVFSNAGYLLTGFFHTRSLDALMANLNCNAVCAVPLTHYFITNMITKKLKGCVVYTSSAAAAMPSPFSVQYAATKSFLSVFGASLAPEVKPFGIDILVFHPSPVGGNSRFYDKAHKLEALEFFKKFAVDPETLPDTVFASIGRTVWRDIGATALGFRLLVKVIDYNFLATLISRIGHTMPDFKMAMSDSVAKPSKSH